jgi:magnesium transporter
MIEILKTLDDGMHEMDEVSEGCWIALTDPSATELLEISEKCNVDIGDLRAPLDEEERSRIEIEDDYTLILVDIPAVEEHNDNDRFVTIPLGIIITKSVIITVCLEETSVLSGFMDGRVRNFFTNKKTRFILQILYKIATHYLIYLRQIDKISNYIEKQLHKSMKNKELIQLLDLEKSLVFFSTSLKATEVTLEKIMRGRFLKLYEEDQDLLEDVLIEVKQAIEMSNIYSNILSGTMDAFASVISNNLNIVMKTLTSVTILILA